MPAERVGEVCHRCGGVGYLIGRRGELAHATPCVCQDACPKCRGQRFIISQQDGYEVASPCSCTHLRERIRLYNEARIPGAYADRHLADFKDRGNDTLRQAHAAMGAYRVLDDVPSGTGLLLMGGPGVGKTLLMVGLLTHLTLHRAIPCLFVDFYQLCARIRGTFGGRGEESEASIIEPLVEVPVLVLDDLGKGQGSAWELTVVDQIVTRRYNAGRIILATTNYFAESELAQRRQAPQPEPGARERRRTTLEDRIDERLVSRLRQTCRFLVLEGVTDYRVELKVRR